jgi:pimeloyl-ACP methyl ester carboxylesterase
LPTNRLQEISCPTLIQWGAHDEWIPVTDADFFVENIPNARVIIYDDAGHVPMEEIPEQTSRDAVNFLNTAD